jgi:hypothetical protein
MSFYEYYYVHPSYHNILRRLSWIGRSFFTDICVEMSSQDSSSLQNNRPEIWLALELYSTALQLSPDFIWLTEILCEIFLMQFLLTSFHRNRVEGVNPVNEGSHSFAFSYR